MTHAEVTDRWEANVAGGTDRTKQRRRDGSPLERVTVNLVPRASEALRRVSHRTGSSMTDAINRAIQVYDYIEGVEANGGALYVREAKESEPQLVKLL